MRGFRTSIEQLRAVDLPLAEKFAAVNRDLEALTTSGSSSVWMDGGETDDSKEMDPLRSPGGETTETFGRAQQSHRADPSLARF
jgi:hypothetical protein